MMPPIQQRSRDIGSPPKAGCARRIAPSMRRKSLPYAPWYAHIQPELIEPGKIYKFEIAVMPTAYRFKKGSRVRLEIANGDSQLTEFVFQHEYTPNKVGRDTIYHDAKSSSHLMLPVVRR